MSLVEEGGLQLGCGVGLEEMGFCCFFVGVGFVCGIFYMVFLIKKFELCLGVRDSLFGFVVVVVFVCKILLFRGLLVVFCWIILMLCFVVMVIFVVFLVVFILVVVGLFFFCFVNDNVFSVFVFCFNLDIEGCFIEL